jgi:hypothetical protein
MRLRIIVGTNYGTLTRIVIVSYVVGHERVRSLLSLYRVYIVSNDDLLWICVV